VLVVRLRLPGHLADANIDISVTIPSWLRTISGPVVTRRDTSRLGGCRSRWRARGHRSAPGYPVKLFRAPCSRCLGRFVIFASVRALRPRPC